MKKKDLTPLYIAITFLISLSVMSIFIAFHTFIKTDAWGQYGDFIGGIIGTVLTGVAGYYAYKAYESQKEQLDNQKIETERQRIETRFFELLKVHRDNLENIIFDTSNSKNGIKKGEELFRHVIDDFKYYYPYFYRFNYDIIDAVKRETKSINQVWTMIFYGYNYFSNIDNNELSKLITFIKINTFNPSSINDELFEYKIIEKKDYEDDINYYSFIARIQKQYGYQSAFDKYFRNLFQIVKYINEKPSNVLSYKHKYEYIKTLRAQLSNAEQAIIFINSLSDLGNPWESQKIANKQYIDNLKTDIIIKQINSNLITKYNFIKNIPKNYLLVIDFEKHYPYVKYEYNRNAKNENRKILKIAYN